jgi:Zn-dependent protease with chaperone function
MFAPFLVFYFFSRRFEYQADRESASRNPEVGISSLVKLHRAVEAPFELNVLTEAFCTHPSLIHRVAAIARSYDISEARVREILGRIGPRPWERAKSLDAASS